MMGGTGPNPSTTCISMCWGGASWAGRLAELLTPTVLEAVELRGGGDPLSNKRLQQDSFGGSLGCLPFLLGPPLGVLLPHTSPRPTQPEQAEGLLCGWCQETSATAVHAHPHQGWEVEVFGGQEGCTLLAGGPPSGQPSPSTERVLQRRRGG